MNAPEVIKFPDPLVELAMSLSNDYLEPGAIGALADHLHDSRASLPPIPIDRQPVIFRMDHRQLDYFETDLTAATPIGKVPLCEQSARRFDIAHLALAASIGTAQSLAEVRHGSIIQDIFPTDANKQTESSSYGSECQFSFHNDQSYLPEAMVPDYVTLACLKNSENAATLSAHADTALELNDSDIFQLRLPDYVFHHTFNRGKATERLGEKSSPILLSGGEIRLGVDMGTSDPKAKRAVFNLLNLLNKQAARLTLRPGEILILPNKYTVHGRDSFKLFPNPTQRRWLKRINIKRA